MNLLKSVLVKKDSNGLKVVRLCDVDDFSDLDITEDEFSRCMDKCKTM